ncbi:MAG: hypothetical protein ACJLS3_14460 [Erythrobacter sp.]
MNLAPNNSHKIDPPEHEYLPAMLALAGVGPEYGRYERDRLRSCASSHDGHILGAPDLALVRPENLGKRADGTLALAGEVVLLRAGQGSAV